MVLVACGWRHTITVSSSGSLYTYGWSKYGQLGHGDFEDHLVPHKVDALKDSSTSQVLANTNNILKRSYIAFSPLSKNIAFSQSLPWNTEKLFKYLLSFLCLFCWIEICNCNCNAYANMHMLARRAMQFGLTVVVL
jgi:hypothetical protein